MPHFFASKINDIQYPTIYGDFEFTFEANCIIGDKTKKIILVKHKMGDFFFLKQNQINKTLVKYNKNLKIDSIDIVKNALIAYAKLSNAEIIFNNLNYKKIKQNSSEFLIKDIKELKKNKNLNIEIGFGSGRHILDLAKNNPNSIFLGIEIYRPAIAQVLNQIKILDLKNLFILNDDCRILFSALPYNIADSIYLHFPIPWDKSPQKRVFGSIFLQNCMKILKQNKFLELRTDSKEYYLYALDIAKKYKNIKIEFNINKKQNIISKYEARWLNQNKDIFNIKFENLLENKNIKENMEDEFKLEYININKILESSNLKFITKEYFLNIKNIYEFSNGYILFILFGSIYAPSKIHLNVSSLGKIETIGDFIPTKDNINAFYLLNNFME